MPLLKGLAGAWVVNEPPGRADAIVVLGGGLENRPFAAARLFHAGWAPRILLMKVKPGPTTELGLTPAEQSLTRQVLLAEGVDATNLVEIGDNVASSYDESLAVREWMRQTGARRIIIPTDPFHTRRVNWLYARELAGMHATVIVMAAPRREYTVADWWTHEQGLIDFQNEVVKYLYYRLKY